MKRAALLLCGALLCSSLPASAQAPQDDVVAALDRQDPAALDRLLGAVQRRFEAGELNEFDLRQAFEPFAQRRDAQTLEALRAWVAAFPGSSVAHLALGMNYRASGTAARGTRSWEKTTTQQREGFVGYFSLAEPELRKSLVLTAKPYLALLELLKIAGSAGTRPFLNATLLLANEALPANQLARVAYARYLLPRWGGSYEKFDAFVAMSRAQGVGEGTLRKLEAMALNDRGMVLFAEHDSGGARALFMQALQVARASGDEGGFRAAYLAASVKHVCAAAVNVPDCRPAVSGLAAATPIPEATSTVHAGEDIDHAIVVLTNDPSEGIRTEYAWLALRYPAARRTSQALIPRASRHYDLLAFTTADGRELKVYFDITAFHDGPRQEGSTPSTGRPEASDS